MKSHLDQCYEILEELGLSYFPVIAVAQIYETGFEINRGYRHHASTEMLIEISFPNDWNQSLELLDHVLSNFSCSRPHIGSRLVTLTGDEEYMALSQKLSKVLLAGFHASKSDELTDAREMKHRQNSTGNRIIVLPCLDDDSRAANNRRILDIDRTIAATLGASAVEAIRKGVYRDAHGNDVQWADQIQNAIASKISIPPDGAIPKRDRSKHPVTRIQVTNQTTLEASRYLVQKGHNPLTLNFANGIQPGGGFLHGARAQEEVLCRSSALHATLQGDPMYEFHLERTEPDSTDWAIYSPRVPVFRDDEGSPISQPWLLNALTCAAPVANRIGRERSEKLLRERIHRVLAIAEAYGHTTLVLGAWGCGAFGNDPESTARDFVSALEIEFRGAFSDIIFAIVDWSSERRFLGPFRVACDRADQISCGLLD